MHGRFRTFLIQAITWHISKARRLNKAIKRGSQVRLIPLQDHHLAATSGDAPSPVEDIDFNRDWAEHLLTIVFEELRSSYESHGKVEVFDVLKAYLTMTSATPSHAEAAIQLRHVGSDCARGHQSLAKPFSKPHPRGDFEDGYVERTSR